jgi:hypothetical protein
VLPLIPARPPGLFPLGCGWIRFRTAAILKGV